jgi:hypothetical protein
MIKKVLLVVVQIVLFYVVFLVGSLVDPFKMRWFLSHPSPTSTRYFVPDGLLLAIGLCLLILAIEAAAKRLRTAGMLTSIAFVVAVLFGFLSKFGWLTHDLF